MAWIRAARAVLGTAELRCGMAKQRKATQWHGKASKSYAVAGR